MYWDHVLQEVLNKGKPSQRFTFTNVGKRKLYDTQRAPQIRKKYRRRKTNCCYMLGKQFNNVYFTKREAQCMIHIIGGKTNQDVAHLLQLSPRTVEFYVQNMKTKLHCRTKSELVGKIITSEFMNYVNFDQPTLSLKEFPATNAEDKRKQ